MVHALKTLRPYLLVKPFELHTDNASLQWLQQQRHVSHHLPRWLNLLAEYQYRVVHIPGRTNPADFLTRTRKRFRYGSGPALRTGYDEVDSELDLFSASPAPAPAAVFVHACGAPSAPRFLHSDFASAFEVLAVTSCVFQRPGGSVYRCFRSFTPRPWAGTLGATRRSCWFAAPCGGQACPPRWRSTSGPALPANTSRPTTYCQPASSSPCRCRHSGGFALASTSLSSRRPCRATTLCRCTLTC